MSSSGDPLAHRAKAELQRQRAIEASNAAATSNRRQAEIDSARAADAAVTKARRLADPVAAEGQHSEGCGCDREVHYRHLDDFNVEHERLQFDITHTYREHWFSVGIERATERHFLSFPVSARVVDYMEYYFITETAYYSYIADPATADTFAEECRPQLHDDLLFIPPTATNRGSAQ
ncbi:hypothetical protein DE4585_02680 [Mycobacteroides salmoniphilum]|uniref:Uncharacterized protein n=1 Tax=Mycobacteroides salmoniphilum TaxID=404941 RepID=A0A4R8S5H2_9MYCO|nr:hypothetical protein [Mycobacteroides salmoniphilum]TDZ82148.1 hypothetical protein DE4585_02680 [Mycobacteroides salmoniphilum]